MIHQKRVGLATGVLLVTLFLSGNSQAGKVSLTATGSKAALKQKQQNTLTTAQDQWQNISAGQRVIGQRTGWFDVGTHCFDGPMESDASFVKKPPMPSYPNYRYSDEWCFSTKVDASHYVMRCCYKAEYYTTSDVTEPIYALQLRIPLNHSIDPTKSSVMYVSDHLEFKDANGVVHSYHPTLSRVENNALIFEVPADTSKGKILSYPKIEYRVTEFQ